MLMILGCLALLAACSDDEPPAKVPPADWEAIEGSDLKRLTLQPRAAERLAIETGAVLEQAVPARDGTPSGTPRLVVPYSAVIYDPNGGTWTYVNPEGLVYYREPLVIDYVIEGMAVLESGPAVGTTVVTTGAAELYGEETGVGK